VVLSWAAQLAYPKHTFGSAVATASTIVVNSVGGQFLTVLFIAGFVAGALGSALTSQASVARIVFAMGRDGVLPRSVFGHLSVRFSTPVVSIVIVGIVSLIAIWISLDTLSNMISFGALIAFTFVNLSVIKHYFFDKKERSGRAVVNNFVIPAIGVVLTLWLWTSLQSVTFIIGGSWLVAGFVILLIVTRFFHRRTPTLDLKE
jgi:putrescine importer